MTGKLISGVNNARAYIHIIDDLKDIRRFIGDLHNVDNQAEYDATIIKLGEAVYRVSDIVSDLIEESINREIQELIKACIDIAKAYKEEEK